MIIREFRRPDVKMVLEIEVSSFKDPYPSHILMDIYNLGAGFLVAQQTNIIVGYIIFWIRFEDEGHIISLAVDKKYRRQGIGSDLVKSALDIFNRFPLKKIKLEVRVGNEAARKFYQKVGFEEKKFMPHYYDDEEDAVVMEMLANVLRNNLPIENNKTN
ncbi:MAG: ribosomal-protein-alanine N-acetyltransferase [Methanobacteriales archaeon Met13]